MVHLKSYSGKFSYGKFTKKNEKGKFNLSGLEKEQVQVTALILKQESSLKNDINSLACIIFIETLKPL